jgi:outer membrane protein OmpA-like peptidoglycan-associated protein
MRKSLIAASMLSLTVAMAPACATKKYVRTEVGTVNSKVDTLSGTLEQTQGRVQQNEARIGEVDTKAEAAGKAAQAAQNSADQAAQAARTVDGKVDKVNSDLTANINSGRKLVYEVTLSEDQGNFKFGKTELPDEAKSRIDQVVSQLKGQAGKDLYIEIEGHTDNVGSKELNYNLGLERAEAVKKYLYAQHQIPLHKINVISYGEDKPVAPNNTRDGRAMNRRVVIRVLS